MGFVIFNYAGKRIDTGVDLEDENIVEAVINVYSGDEVLTVRHRSGRTYDFDSSKLSGFFRDFSFYDGITKIKEEGRFLSVWDNAKFRNRNRSDWVYSGY